MKSNQLNDFTNIDYPVITASGGWYPYYFLNLVVFIGVSFLVPKYTGNPGFIGVAIGILIFVVLPINSVEYFFAENEQLVVLYKKVFFLQFLNRKRRFRYKEIQKITAILAMDKEPTIIAFIGNLLSRYSSPVNSLEIEMKNGKKKNVATNICNEKLLPILNFMQSKEVDIQINYPDKKIHWWSGKVDPGKP